MNIETYAAILKQFMRFLEQLSRSDLDALDKQTKRIEFSLCSSSVSRLPSSADITAIIEKLKNAEDKIVVNSLIDTLTKNELLQICRALDLPVRKADKIERIRERIVQSTVGFRTRSQAIQKESRGDLGLE